MPVVVRDLNRYRRLMDFDFEGMYRVQSRTVAREGRLRGDWFVRGDALLSAAAVNSALSGNSWWSGVPVNLRCAMVVQRDGMFHDVPDNLYKIECFTPFDEARTFPSHIVDIRKASDQWRERWPLVAPLFAGGQSGALAGLIDDLPVTIANEYYCHEAGHVFGRPVQSKSSKEYFKPVGKIAWPLIWMEEFRADLHSYSVALDLLEPRQAAAVFLYNFFARLAGDRLSLKQRTYGCGPIPFLLFALLVDLGFLRLVNAKSRLKLLTAGASADSIVPVMRACHDHALEAFTQPELSAVDHVDWGINAARYYRERVVEHPIRSDYLELLASE